MKTPVQQPSLRDIARQLNVSHVTVSMALRDHPRISVERRAEVRKVAEALGYRPDPMLASLVAYRNRKRVKPVAATLAWLNCWPEPAKLRQHKEFDSYWLGARAAAERLGYRLEEFVIDKDMKGRRLNGILLARGVKGLLVPPHRAGMSWSDLGLDWKEFSLVRFGFSTSDLRAHMIGNDQMRSSELAVRQMADAGYRRIGYVGSESHDAATDANFRMGYLRGIELDQRLTWAPPILLGPGQRLESAEVGQRVVEWIKENAIDALLTSESGLMELCERHGLRVPDDVAIAATSARDGGRVDAGLDQNPVEIGRVAVHTLIESINRREFGEPDYCRRVLVESRWVAGASLPIKRSCARAD